MIDEFFQTLIVIGGAILSIFAVGFCLVNQVVKFLKISCTSEQRWAVMPLVGTGAIILFCQNLLYLDVRIPYSAAVIWVGLVLFAIAAAARGRLNLREVPWGLLATGLMVYVVHASGLIASGASNYYGYGWADMYNYVAQAQFFLDFPFSLVTDAHEYVQVANAFKDDRIGQTVLHSFISATAGADAQRTFGATILLSPMLIFFSAYLLSTNLNIQRRYAFPSAVVASLSPAIASVHLEGFFSQAMAMPFVFLWPLAISRLKSRPGAGSIMMAGLLWAVTSAIYTELIPALTLIAAIVIIAPNWRPGDTISQSIKAALHKDGLRSVAVVLCSLGLAVAFGLLANVGYVKGAMVAMARTTRPSVLDVLYPWAFKTEGLARLWIGHQMPSLSGWAIHALALGSVIIFVVAIVYGIALYRKGKTSAPLFALLIACVPLAPLLLSIVTRHSYPYQFFKLLLTVWPLILLLGICGISEWLFRIHAGRSFIYFQIALVCTSLGLTNRIAHASSKVATTATSARGASHLLIDQNFRQIRKKLESLEGRQVYIWWYDKALWDGTWRGRWLGYFARKNTVWSMKLIDSTVPGEFFEFLPSDGVKLPAIGISWKEVAANAKEKIGSSDAGTDPFWFYQLTDEAEVRRIDRVSRAHGVLSRSMRLHVEKGIEADVWYPLWTAGRPGAASLISANFGKLETRFRYDQWGVPAVIISPGKACSGKDYLLDIQIDMFKKKMLLTCNGVIGEYPIPLQEYYLGSKDPLGVNEVTSTLEGKYPLAKDFPGKIIDAPSIN